MTRSGHTGSSVSLHGSSQGEQGILKGAAPAGQAKSIGVWGFKGDNWARSGKTLVAVYIGRNASQLAKLSLRAQALFISQYITSSIRTMCPYKLWSFDCSGLLEGGTDSVSRSFELDMCNISYNRSYRFLDYVQPRSLPAHHAMFTCPLASRPSREICCRNLPAGWVRSLFRQGGTRDSFRPIVQKQVSPSPAPTKTWPTSTTSQPFDTNGLDGHSKLLGRR